MSIDLGGRVAVITGAGRGIGRAIALALGGAGASLALSDIDRAALEETRSLLGDAASRTALYDCDVRVQSQVDAMAASAVARFGALHILVNNAGTAVRKPIHEFSLDEWNRVMDTNLTGAFLLCRACIPHMLGRGYGRIINIASVMGHVSSAGRGVYSASKHGLIGLTRGLALELATEGITAVAISPGFIATDLTAPLRADPAKNQALMDQTPMRRWGKAQEIGELALYLCSDGAAFMSGNDVLIDGGWAAQ